MNLPAKVLPLHEARSHRASEVARAILAGFDRHYRLFRDASRQAKRHFESGDWAAMRALARERIEMYDARVEEAVRGILDRFPEAEVDETLWPAIKLAYIPLLHEHRQPPVFPCRRCNHDRRCPLGVPYRLLYRVETFTAINRAWPD